MSQTYHSVISATALTFSVTVAAIILSLGIFFSAKTLKSGAAFNDKSAAVQGCAEVAQGFKKTMGKGSTSDSTWEVSEASINQDVMKFCLEQKGY